MIYFLFYQSWCSKSSPWITLFILLCKNEKTIQLDVISVNLTLLVRILLVFTYELMRTVDHTGKCLVFKMNCCFFAPDKIILFIYWLSFRTSTSSIFPHCLKYKSNWLCSASGKDNLHYTNPSNGAHFLTVRSFLAILINEEGHWVKQQPKGIFNNPFICSYEFQMFAI